MQRRRIAALLLATGLATGAGWWTARQLGASDLSRGSDAGATASTAMSEMAERDVDIAVWSQALAQDSLSALALAQLAGLHLQRAREGGEHADYQRAESLARRSLALRTNHNGKTYVTLAASLLAQHRFAEAREVAQLLVAAEPEVPQYRALLGEVQLELGDYAGARIAFDSLHSFRTHLSIAPRLARWAELRGDVRAARRLLAEARDQAVLRRDIPREQLAWFHLRLGDLELRHGRLRGAARSFEEGLAVEPNDHRLLSAMARLEVARGRPERAIEYGERAIGLVLDPATLGVISDAYAELGDSARAAEYASTMEVAVSGEPGPFHRAWALFLLDHGRNTAEVLASAQEEIAMRRDIHGHDLLAWALHKEGRHAEARQAIADALRLGTPDALLLYHAGMIERAAGDAPAARRHLEQALSVNPHFQPAGVRVARATLDSLDREQDGRGGTPSWIARLSALTARASFR